MMDSFQDVQSTWETKPSEARNKTSLAESKDRRNLSKPSKVFTLAVPFFSEYDYAQIKVVQNVLGHI